MWSEWSHLVKPHSEIGTHSTLTLQWCESRILWSGARLADLLACGNTAKARPSLRLTTPISKIWDSLKAVEHAQESCRTSIDPRRDRRCGPRLWAYARVLVYGITANDEPFHEPTEILRLNARGGLMTLTTAVNPGFSLLLINKANHREQKCQIVGHRGSYLNRSVMGFEFSGNRAPSHAYLSALTALRPGIGVFALSYCNEAAVPRLYTPVGRHRSSQRDQFTCVSASRICTSLVLSGFKRSAASSSRFPVTFSPDANRFIPR